MSERIRLKGHRYTVRAMTEADAAAVLASFGRLSATSLRYRFFSPGERITPGIAADLTRVDPRRIVLLAIDEDGEVAGEARTIRRTDDPATADVAVTIADAHQRRGLGTKLLRRLRSEAKSAGIERLVGHILTDNAAAQSLLVASHAVCWFEEPGVVAFEIPLGRRTVAPEVASRRIFGLAS